MLEILPVRFMCPVLMQLVGALGTTAQEQVANGDQPTKVIEVSAKKYEFTPNEIHVKKDTKVELKVQSVDEPHGIKLSGHAKASKDKRSPGVALQRPLAKRKSREGQGSDS